MLLVRTSTVILRAAVCCSLLMLVATAVVGQTDQFVSSAAGSKSKVRIRALGTRPPRSILRSSGAWHLHLPCPVQNQRHSDYGRVRLRRRRLRQLYRLLILARTRTPTRAALTCGSSSD